MTSSSVPHDPLRAVRDAVRDTVRASGRARRHDVETCLDVSARHVGVALWASGLERIWRTNEAAGNPPLLGLDHALLITATPTLLLGSAVTALDQCGAAAAFYGAEAGVESAVVALRDILAGTPTPTSAQLTGITAPACQPITGV